MEFGLSREQQMLFDSLDRAMAAQAGLPQARLCAAAPGTLPPQAWRSLVELGAASLLVPEAQDGLGLDLFDAALAAQVLGRHVGATPFVPHSLAVLALRLCDDTALQQVLLPDLASGALSCGVALSESASPARDGAGIRLAQGRLHGTALFALGLPGAAHVLVADQHRQMHLVPADAAGLAWRPMPSVDTTTPLCALTLHAVAARPLPSATPAEDLARVLAAGRMLLAADTLGAAEHMLAQALAHVQQRQQFGRAIGSFQAIKHLFADMAATLEPARSLTWYAAYAQDQDPAQRSLLAALAKSHVSDVALQIARTATEMHGAMGITDDLGLHFWFQRIAQNRQLLGGPAWLRTEAARLQGLVPMPA